MSISVDALRTHITDQRERIFTDLAELIAFNSVHGTPPAADAARWVEQALIDAGLDVTAHDTVDGSIALIGRKEPAPGQPTVLLYSHYDIVPAGDAAEWTSPPFELTERDGRWYGRGAADCKGNLIMHLAVLRALAELGGTDLGLIVLVEGSEEQGGEGLDHLLRTRPELFDAAAILIADSGNAAVGVPTLTTMLRGGGQLTVTVDTLQAPVHSGLFGGAAPDAVAALVRILDSLRDEHGRTVIDGVPTDGRWDGAPYIEDAFRADAGMLEGTAIMGTAEDRPADLVWARPAVTVTGFTSTPVAEAVNAVPATASAQLNLRVPPGMDAADVAKHLAEHLTSRAPWGAKVTVDITETNDPFATDITGPALSLLSDCLAAAYDAEETTTVGSGGSIPLTLTLQEQFPAAEIAVFGVEEPQSTIHSPDESVDPTEIIHVAVAEAAFLQAWGK